MSTVSVVSTWDIKLRPPLSAVVSLLESAGLPTADLTDEHCTHFLFTGEAAAPTGLIGLELFGDLALLRSLVVIAANRRSGAGSAFVTFAEDYARAQGVGSIYLLTTTAEQFFARRGYERAERKSAPAAIRSTREFAGICPASSAFMSKKI